MITIIAIIFPLLAFIPLILFSLNFFPKVFPDTAHFYILAVSLAGLATPAMSARGTLDGWPEAVAFFLAIIFGSGSALSALAGLWDTYAKAHNGTKSN